MPIVTAAQSSDPDPNAGYRTLAEAFAFFNRELFAGELPPVLITLQREHNTRGYYAHEAFTSRTAAGQAAISEIALNPAAFAGRSDLEILSTLAHEMCHLWQAYHGKPSRGGYHNAQWAGKMDAIGLHAAATDGSGRSTGQSMSHSISEDGAFARAAARFLAGSRLQWQAREGVAAETAAQKRASKTKYTCPTCGQNAWAKPDAHLMCSDCMEEMSAARSAADRSAADRSTAAPGKAAADGEDAEDHD